MEERVGVKVQENHAVILPYEPEQEYWIAPVDGISKKRFYHIVKRMFDVAASFVALIILAIPMAIIAIMIRVDSEGPVFFVQERLGKDGKTFRIYKFRSMVMNAEKNGAQWSNGVEDDRITALGHVLRQSRLDELPQLWNIFQGDMSCVGPRPERACFYDEFETYIHGFHQRLCVKPGLTGLAQVRGGYDLRPEEKIVYDMEYIKNQSIGLDWKIIFDTVRVVVLHEGAK